ncbi:hypothetical protein NON00_08930 [Roseomonas sp. GC11]|uniref:hypothetical protein n=1 Tax=Roseomonas sp. GC11 TaxID=2950546 RepID=UPI00210E522B|nr:hypothetical protein [Roseomonas sp. GC11]MCQ4160051.1 hypothetical protein [Roseomonas sp. GC11]
MAPIPPPSRRGGTLLALALAAPLAVPCAVLLPATPGFATERGAPKSATPCTTPARLALRPQEAAAQPPLRPDQPLCLRLRRGESAYFRVAAEAGRDYAVETRQLARETDPVLAALDADGTVLLEDDDGGEEALAARLEVGADAAVRLIRVGTLGDQGGRFTLALRRLPPQPVPDFATSAAQAATRPPLALGQAVALTLRRHQRAYFALPAERAGLLAITRDLREGTDTVLELLDARGEVVAEDDDGGGDLASALSLADGAGAVVLRVRTLEGAPGRFNLVLEREPPAPPADFPTSLEAARAAPPLEAGRRSLTFGRRQSAYFSLPAEGEWILRTDSLSDGADTVLALLDAEGRVLAEDDDGGGGLASRIATRRAPQRPAFLSVRMLDGRPGRFDLVSQAMPRPGATTAPPVAVTAGVTDDLAEAARRPTLLLGEAVALDLGAGEAAVFALPHDGRPAMALTFALPQGTGTALEWLDAEGKVLAAQQGDLPEGGRGVRLTLPAVPRPSFLRVLQTGDGQGHFQLVLIRPAPGEE